MKNEITKKDTQTESYNETVIYSPRVDVIENGKNVTLIADMPGVCDKGVELELDGHELTIKGSFESELSEDFKVSHNEYKPGSYERTFTLGDVVDRNKIKAVMKDGVLTLTLPKVKEAQPRKIKVARA